MKRTITKISILAVMTSLAIAALGLWSCNSGGTDAGRELVGTWQGTEVGGDGTVWTFTISDNAVTARAETQEVYRGSWSASDSTYPRQVNFAVRSSSVGKYVGQTSLVIYDIQGDHLTLVSNEPGNETRPTSFEPNPEVRVWNLTRQ